MVSVAEVWWLFPLAFALHNLEEAIWLPHWSHSAGRWQRPVSALVFRFALVVLTALAWALSAAVLVWPARRSLRLVYYGWVGAMMINVLVPHLAATLALRRYVPGVLTGVGVLWPLGGWLMARALAAGDLDLVQWGLATVVIGGVLLGSIPILFWLGDRLFNRGGIPERSRRRVAAEVVVERAVMQSP